MFWFHSLTWNCPVSPEPLIKKIVFSALCFLAFFVIDWLIIKYVGFFFHFLSCSIDLVSVFVPVPFCFDYYSFVVFSKVRVHDSSSSVLLSQYCLVILCFHTNFKSFRSSSVKNAIGNLIGLHWICILPWVVWSFQQYWFFQCKNMVNLSICLCCLQFLSPASYNFWNTGTARGKYKQNTL